MEIPAITFPILGEDFELNFLPYFTIFGWKIHWYGVIIAVGFLLAVWYCSKRAASFGILQDDLIDTLILAVPLSIIGARLYYVLFYHENGVNPYFDGEHDLKDIIAIWNGGLAIYGGIIFGILGVWIVTKRKKIRTRAFADLCALGLLIAQAIGRWGNFCNREAHGGETRVPWRMGLKYSFKTFYFHPTFLYESLWNLIGFLILHFWSKKHRKYDGQLFLAYAAWYGFGRFFIEGLRTDSLYVGTTNLRVSQLVGALTCLAAVAVMLYIRFFKHPEADSLWVNRDRAAAAEQEAAKLKLEREQEAAEEEFDEELSDAFRLLKNEPDPDGLTEEPVVEPIDFREASITEPEDAEPLQEEPATIESETEDAE